MLAQIDRNVTPHGLEGSRQDAVTLNEKPRQATTDPQEAFWLSRARDAYQSGKDWFDGSVRKQIEANLAHFRNQHAPGSKYHNEIYNKKSKMFRPRTRAMVRRTEAAMAIAYFSTSDLVNVSAVNEARKDQVDAAEVKNQLLNYRLENSLPWFSLLMGGAQDAANTGIVISKQYWKYDTRQQAMVDVYEEEDGTLSHEDGQPEEEIIQDCPWVDLCAIENILLDPASHWLDPINTSPYLVELIPMYVFEVKELANRLNPRTGKTIYRKIEGGIVQAAIAQDWDSIRRMREGQRIDKYEADSYVNEYQTVWVHRNIVREQGRDWTYDTLGTEVQLSDPELLDAVYPHLEGRERPYKMGTLMLEAHKLYPMAPVELVSGMQQEVNDLANLRMDNVKLGLNKRYFVSRGEGVDINTLVRNVPGSAVMMNRTDAVKETQPQDVTQSSYQEQERLNLEFDEVSGTFSSSSVGSNRKLNETVGGMTMLSADASQIKEYEIRTITETWVEGVLRQLVQLESYYETDEELLDQVASTTKLPVARVLEVIQQPVRTRVNVGFNSTAPERRIGKVMVALEAVAKVDPTVLSGLDITELLKELFGAVGYRDGSRFFKGDEDPRVTALQQQVQQLQQVIDTKQVEQQGKVQVAQVTGEYRVAGIQLQQTTAAQLGQLKTQLDTFRAKLEEVDRQLDMERSDKERQELYLQREALSHQVQEADRDFMLRLMEVGQKQQEGAPGGGGGKPKGAYNLPGNDKAGVLSRDQYGDVPQNSA